MSKIPYSNSQNPSPNPNGEGQEFINDKQELVNAILTNFKTVLPSNYVALTNGPFYLLQFQALSEQLADIQLSTTEIYKDSLWDFTRPDFLWQVLGSLVFPDSSTGIPQIDGDKTYRDFLSQMVVNILKGSTLDSLKKGLESLEEGLVVDIVERYLSTPPRNPQGSNTLEDQFLVDIFLEGFSSAPFVLQQNAKLVIQALKPAHVFYGFSFLFRDAFGVIASDDGGLILDLDSYYYGDMRKWCYGAERISGTGEVLSSRNYFSDPDVSFKSIKVGSQFKISSGENKGLYKVTEVRYLLSGADAALHSYTLSSGGSGTLLQAIDYRTLRDPSIDWGSLPRDTKITITTGPNAGTYRLDTVMGSTGGEVGNSGVSGSTVRVSPTLLRLNEKPPKSATGQPYEVGVDRLGVQHPHAITAEDVSSQFVL